MPNIRCTKGHYYDPAKHLSCPYCGVNLEIPPTKTVQATGTQTTDTVKMGEPHRVPNDPGVTRRIVTKEQGMNPVVGWIVCVKGPDKGRDYRLRPEKNFMGRSAGMDVCIEGDETISRDNHASISYDPRSNTFKLLPGESHGLVYLNGEDVAIPTSLKADDIIDMGQSSFVFVPFCTESFKWKSE